MSRRGLTPWSSGNLLAAARVVPVCGRRVTAAAVLAVSLSTAASSQSPALAATTPDTGVFRFTPEARSELHALWEQSVRADQERVACLGGVRLRDRVRISHIEPVAATRADSANVSASSSLKACAPPEWLGTVHTHIAHFNGRPYIIFSAPDRLVMQMWRDRWRAEGVFCLLYTDHEATCEAGYALTERVAYVNPEDSVRF